MAVTEVSRGIFDISAAESGSTLIPFEADRGKINNIMICNQHASTTATVSLHLDDILGATNDIYIIKNVEIPAGVTLAINDMFSFENTKHSLKVTNTGGIPLSIIIK
tara:strand:+ start:36 stop:356 length:321 start_codon:yes stop_codon:yes gene_type:complete